MRVAAHSGPKRRNAVWTLAVLTLLGLGAAPGEAAGQTACPSFSSKPSDTNHDISLSGFSQVTATAADFTRTYALLYGTVRVSGVSSTGTNALCIRSASPNLGATATGLKPLSDFRWSADNGATWHSVTGSFVEISGVRWSSSSKTVNLQFLVLLNWALDSPSSYLADLQFKTGRVQ